MGVGITPVSAEGTGERPEDVVVGLPCFRNQFAKPFQAACYVVGKRAILALKSACEADLQRNQRCGEAESEQYNGGNFGHFACG